MNTQKLKKKISVLLGISFCLVVATIIVVPIKSVFASNIFTEVTPFVSPFVINSGNPIITPKVNSYEQNAVFEPSVIYDNGIYKMTYSAGWSNTGIGIATSTDGIHWTKYANNPVIGLGAGGVSGFAARGTFIKVGSEYRVYFADANPEANIRLATSNDGINFNLQPTIVIGKYDVTGARGWANVGLYNEGTDLWMLVEGYHTTPAQWETYLFKSIDGGLTFQKTAGPLRSLQISPNAAYGGTRSIKKIGDVYHVWYHAGTGYGVLPTVVWHATSYDLINWTPDSGPTIPLPGSEMGLMYPDQTADASILETPSGKTFLYYDADDNRNGATRIGVAIFDGTLQALSDATLSNLAISSGTLNPLFTSSTTNYTVNVANNITDVAITATANNTNTKIRANGTPIFSGSPSYLIPISLGSNTITIDVTAPDSVTKKTYTITVVRQAILTVPSAPTNVTAVAGNTKAIVSFTAPVNTGGTPILSYKVKSYPGSKTNTGTSSPIIITGLQNNRSYTFTVIATNSVGNSSSSVASNPVKPINLPPTVSAGPNQILSHSTKTTTLTGSATDSDGTILSYYWYKVSGRPVTITNYRSATTTVNSLKTGTYVFRLRVTDNQGARSTSDVTVTVQ